MHEEMDHVHNKHASETIRVQFDGQFTEWAPNETKRVPKSQVSHMIMKGLDSAGMPQLERLDPESAPVALAESELAVAKRELERAKSVHERAAEAVVRAEKNVKVARAKRDALAATNTIVEEPGKKK